MAPATEGPQDSAYPGVGLVVAEGDLGDSSSGVVVCGLVASQTCDVVATGTGRQHPTVQVCPVVRVGELNEQLLEEMRRWSVADGALLEPVG